MAHYHQSSAGYIPRGNRVSSQRPPWSHWEPAERRERQARSGKATLWHRLVDERLTKLSFTRDQGNANHIRRENCHLPNGIALKEGPLLREGVGVQAGILKSHLVICNKAVEGMIQSFHF